MVLKLGRMNVLNLQSCFQDEASLGQPIHWSNLKNFCSDAAQVKTSAKFNKIKELQRTQYLFGCLPYLTNSVNLEIVFAYPSTPVPMSVAHIDGSIDKMAKSKLLYTLEHEIITSSPESHTVHVLLMLYSLSIESLTHLQHLVQRHSHKNVKNSERVDFVHVIHIRMNS